jgi:hypothetical protein
VYPAIVIDSNDPEGGRVKIALPWAPEAWCQSGYVDGRQQSRYLVNSGFSRPRFWCHFEGVNADRLYVIGSLWNVPDQPPASMDGENNLKVLRSRNGSSRPGAPPYGDSAKRFRYSARAASYMRVASGSSSTRMCGLFCFQH